MHAFQPRRRKHKPGTGNLNRRQKFPTRSGSDGPVTYSYLPRTSQTGLLSQQETDFIPNQESPHRSSHHGRESHKELKDLKRLNAELLAQSFDAAEEHSSDEEEDFSVDGLLEPYQDSGETEFDVPFVQDRVTVSKILRFSRLENHKGWTGWEAWISIKNRTKLNITYCVMTSPDSTLTVKPKISWILPSAEVKVQVLTDKDFKTFSKDFVTIFVAPVFFRHQLVQEKFHVLWDALGSNFFPFEQAEEHPIPYISAKDEEALGAFSLIDRLSLFNPQGNQRKLAKAYLHKGTETLFREFWDIDTDSFEIKLKYQLREIKRTIRRVKAKADAAAQASFNIRACSASLVMAALISFGIQHNLFGPPYTVGLFKVTGGLYGFIPPPEEPKGWTDTITDWFGMIWTALPIARWVREAGAYFQ